MRIRFVVTTPYGNTRMIAYTLNLLHHVIIEHIEIIRQVRIRINPKIIPQHNSVFVTGFIEFIIGYRAEPVANHIKVHLFVQTNLCIILCTTTAKHILRHTPVGPFYKYRNVIYINMKSVILLIICIFFNTESDIFYFRYFSVYFHFKGTSIQIRLSVSVRPPQFRTINHQLRIITLIEANSRSSICRQIYLFRKGNVTRLDGPCNNSFNRFAFIVFHFQLNR